MPASSEFSNPTSRFGSACGGSRESTWRRDPAGSLLAQPPAFTCCVKRTDCVGSMLMSFHSYHPVPCNQGTVACERVIRWKRLGSGDPPGLQNRRSSLTGEGGFDSHALPPVPRLRLTSTSILLDVLIHELQCKLHLARSPRFKDMVECRRTDVAVGQKEVRTVQNVKQLRAELKMRRFGYLDVLKGGEVPVGISRTDIHVAAFGAKLSRVGDGIESLVSAGIKPCANRTGPVVGVANEIGSLGRESGDLWRAALRRN